MTRGPSLVEVRARVRTRETWELLLLAGGLQNVTFEGTDPSPERGEGGGRGNPPKAAVARFKAMQDAVAAELERRGIVVAPNPDLAAVATYGGEIAGSSPGGREA